MAENGSVQVKCKNSKLQFKTYSILLYLNLEKRGILASATEALSHCSLKCAARTVNRRGFPGKGEVAETEHNPLF